jgi:peptidyl-prolyl cis-trans isomerase A (cyclophilin A)/peptidyl-prolyl cis-trans isomerase B (cyclophilin B)
VGLGANRVVIVADTGGLYRFRPQNSLELAAWVESRTMKNNRLSNGLVLGILGMLFSLAAQAAGPERVRVTTSLGAFVVELQRDRAPLTVENFVGYVKSGYYTNTLFHRVIANFVIQGGGVGPDYKAKPTLKPIPNEAGNGLKNLRGTVGLARASGAHSGDAQFYVNIADNADLDPLPTRWGYAVFGRVVEGMEVVDRISVSPTGAQGPFKADAPVKAVVIQKIELLADTTTAVPPAAPPAAEPPAAPAPADVPGAEGATPPAAGEAPAPAAPPAEPAAGETPPQ